MPFEKDKSFKFDKLSSVHEQIQDSSPTPNEPAIAAHEQKATAKIELAGEQKDSVGTVFNSELHATNREGEPSLTATGKFRKKKGASKVALQPAAIEEQRNKANAQAAASAAVDMSVQTLEILLGPEWKPVQQDGLDERENLKAATTQYFIAKDIHDFPPGVALSVVLIAYAMPRFATGQETQSRMSKAKFWAAEKWKKFKRGRKNGAQPDSGDNGERENDTGKDASSDESETGTRHPRT